MEGMSKKKYDAKKALLLVLSRARRHRISTMPSLTKYIYIYLYLVNRKGQARVRSGTHVSPRRTPTTNKTKKDNVYNSQCSLSMSPLPLEPVLQPRGRRVYAYTQKKKHGQRRKKERSEAVMCLCVCARRVRWGGMFVEKLLFARRRHRQQENARATAVSLQRTLRPCR